jgi:hypothetical protein
VIILFLSIITDGLGYVRKPPRVEILHPPENVPREMADAATIITGIGITKDLES